MSEFDLKAYTTRAKELEAAIYTQKNLMSSHEKVINDKRPMHPKKKTVVAPTKPELQEIYVEDKKIDNIWGLVSGIVCFIAAIILATTTSVIFGIVLGLASIGGFATFSDNLKEKEHVDQMNDEYRKTYEEEMERYPKLLEEYKKEMSAANELYQKKMNGYKVAIENHNARCYEIMDKHNSALAVLEESLEELYSENIIFPKYRNLVAISTINEYLSSGRCDKLEGPDGAYNLYEMELRQNIIIAQLSSIINNLEQIKGSQFFLYQELQKSNCTINEILSETRRTNETTKLTAYFSGVTALAETSPKYYHGIIM